MTTSATSPQSAPIVTAPVSRRHSWLGLLIIGVVSLVVMLPLLLVTGCFRVSAETRMIRESLLDSAVDRGRWEPRIHLHGGALALGLVRTIAGCIDDIPPEARTCMHAVRGAEVGIYEFRGGDERIDRAACISSATEALSKHSWDRVVSVINDDATVAAFVRNDSDGESTDMRACVLVFHARSLVVVSARLDMEPLVALARAQIHDQHAL